MQATDAKPNLRGLHAATIQRNLYVALGLCCASVFLVKFLYTERKKKKYRIFYRDYDAEKSFERMRKAGVFQSCSADGEEEE